MNNLLNTKNHTPLLLRRRLRRRPAGRDGRELYRSGLKEKNWRGTSGSFTMKYRRCWCKSDSLAVISYRDINVFTYINTPDPCFRRFITRLDPVTMKTLTYNKSINAWPVATSFFSSCAWLHAPSYTWTRKSLRFTVLVLFTSFRTLFEGAC